MKTLLASAIALSLITTAFVALPADAKQAPAATRAAITTQLPRDVRPSHYAVTVTPRAQDMAFDAHVDIRIRIDKPVRSITLNQLNMQMPSVSLKPASGKGASLVPKVSIDNDKQTAQFAFERDIAPGDYVLAIDYTGKIETQATGLFALDYTDQQGKPQRALYTQFENSDFRRFVPSWDEPAHKATFDLTAIVPADQMAVSNMPVASSQDAGNGRKRVTFQRSPKMSTYLLFFGLGDFERANVKAEGVDIGVITQKGMSSQAQFALDESAKIIREYNDYFGVKYPLPKLDNVAAPGQSQFFSAMENWGAIFTFEYAMLLDPRISTEGTKIRISSTAAHEIAHQWFGDLVTMQWWDDLWLNEGFASWLQGRTTAKMHPEWKTHLSEVGSRDGAMSRDSVATTHPVVQHIETVEQASQAFDAITYSKGAAVITMLEAYTGETAWRDGVRRYMKRHAYGNTATDDLWAAIDAGNKKPITAIAHDFTLQPGIPLIDVVQQTCNAGKTTLQFTQGEYTRDRPGKTPLRWRVPVIAQVQGHPANTTVVQGGKGAITLQGCGTAIVNAGQSGYYRTRYTDAAFTQIVRDFSKIDTIDQLGLMSDAWALGLAGDAPVSRLLQLADGVPADADPTVWQDIVGTLSSLDSYFDGDKDNQALLRAFAVSKLQPLYAQLGWDAKAQDSVQVKGLRGQVISILSEMGDTGVIAEANRRYLASGTAPMTPEVRNVVLSVVARNADAAMWERLHAEAKAEKTPMVRTQLYYLLSAARDPALARRALDLALTDEPGATMSAGMIGGVSGEHPDMAFDFAVAHRDKVDLLVDSTSRARYYPGLGDGSSDPAMIGKLRDYASKYVAEGSRREFETAIAAIEYRVKVRKERMPDVVQWLRNRTH